MADPSKGNCLACHAVASLSNYPDHGDLGPSLNGVGGRYTTAQIRQIVVDPKLLFSQTIMPAYYNPPAFRRTPQSLIGKTLLSASEVEDVVAFLANLK